MDKEKVLKKYGYSNARRGRNVKEEKKEGSLFIFQGYISAIIVFAVIIMTIAGGDGSRKILDKVGGALQEQVPFQQVVEKGSKTVEAIRGIGGQKNDFSEDKSESGDDDFKQDTSVEGQRIYMDTGREDSGKLVR